MSSTGISTPMYGTKRKRITDNPVSSSQEPNHIAIDYTRHGQSDSSTNKCKSPVEMQSKFQRFDMSNAMRPRSLDSYAKLPQDQRDQLAITANIEHQHLENPNRYAPRLSPDQTLLLALEEMSKACIDLQPCNNPACEDIQPCTADLDPCFNPQQCLGNICYDSNCSPGEDGFDFSCDQGCESSTRCATPCFGDSCGVPACQAPCNSTSATASHGTTFGHQQIGQQILCKDPDCEIPGTQCVNPQCLSLDYVPASPSHVHHGLDEFCKHGGRWPLDAGVSEYSCLAPATYPCHRIPDHSHWNEPLPSFLPDPIPTTHSYDTTSSLQPLVDWTNAYSTYPNHAPSTDAESHLTGLTPGTSVAPSTPASQSVRGVSLLSQRNCRQDVCLWLIPSGSGERICGAMFNNPSDLHAHLEKNHIEPLQRDPGALPHEGYYCRWRGCCRSGSVGRPAVFAARPKLKRHAQTHTLYKPFTCPTCGVAMKTKDAMEKHERTHSGERPYGCKVSGCNKIFATSTELKTHMVVHSGRKPHECPICHEGFADSSNLSKHKKTHYVGMYRCPDANCGARMKRWDQMRRHIASQEHALGLLDDVERQREYKAQMEREWRVLPEAEKLLYPV